MASQAQLAGILLRREGPQFLSKDGKQLRSTIWLVRPYVFWIYFHFLSSPIPETMKDELERIYRRAGSRKLWSEIHTYSHTHTLIYVISSAIFYCLSEDQFYSELLKRAGLQKSQV